MVLYKEFKNPECYHKVLKAGLIKKKIQFYIWKGINVDIYTLESSLGR